MDNLQNLTEGGNIVIHSGFPNPANDRLESRLALNLNDILVKHPSSTYLFRIAGHNWSDQGIYDGDIVIVDRTRLEHANDLVVSREESSFNLIRRPQLTATNQEWGIVSAVIHRF